VVNALLGLLLPFALSPLVKYNCSERVMGVGNASRGVEKTVLYTFAIVVWAINAITLSIKGGGFFGEWASNIPMSFRKILLILLEIGLQLFYAGWNFYTLFGNPKIQEQWNPETNVSTTKETQKDDFGKEMKTFLPVDSADAQLT
jgi:hypothetical protein